MLQEILHLGVVGAWGLCFNSRKTTLRRIPPESLGSALPALGHLFLILLELHQLWPEHTEMVHGQFLCFG